MYGCFLIIFQNCVLIHTDELFFIILPGMLFMLINKVSLIIGILHRIDLVSCVLKAKMNSF